MGNPLEHRIGDDHIRSCAEFVDIPNRQIGADPLTRPSGSRGMRRVEHLLGRVDADDPRVRPPLRERERERAIPAPEVDDQMRRLGRTRAVNS